MNKNLLVILFIGLNLTVGMASYCEYGFYDKGDGICQKCP